MFKRIKVGDIVELTVYAGSKGSMTYKSKVLDIVNEKEQILAIYSISGANAEETYHIMDDLRFSKFTSLFHTGTSLFKYSSVFKGRTKSSSLNGFLIQLNGEGEKIQRRDFFRLDVHVPMKFRAWNCPATCKVSSILEEIDEGEGDDANFVDGTILDISGNGVKFSSDVEFQPNCEKCSMHIKFQLGDEEIELVGALVDLDKKFVAPNYKYNHYVKFLDMPQIEQDKIIKYIFAEQKRRAEM